MSSTHPTISPPRAAIAQRRMPTPVSLLCAIYIPTTLLIAVLLIVSLITGVPLRYFFIDPVAEFNAPMYIGLLSNLGVLLWCSAASVCLFASVLLFGNRDYRDVFLFLLCSGLFTSLLMLDDLYLLHEEVLPDHLHIPQPLVFGGYGILVVTYFIWFRRTILRSEYLLLALALSFFALSVFVDLAVTPEEFSIGGVPARHLVEDGLKLLGIVSWATYLIRFSLLNCSRFIRDHHKPAAELHAHHGSPSGHPSRSDRKLSQPNS